MWKHMLTKHGRHGQGARRDPLEVEVITDSFFVFLDMRISHTVNGQVLLGEVTDAEKLMNPQHFWTDLGDIWIRITPAVWSQIWVTFG